MTAPADDMVADAVSLLRALVAEGLLVDVAVAYEGAPGRATHVTVRSDYGVPLTLLAQGLVARGWRKEP